jgi:3'-phosphoadenosine 5'-phosphosulfate (PAPS) 3'-phosphatase
MIYPVLTTTTATVLLRFSLFSAVSRAMSTTSSVPPLSQQQQPPPPQSELVHLLDLATACVACTLSAAQTIDRIAAVQNARLKADGTCVTDADYAAQGLICQAVRAVSRHVRIVGEESEVEMAAHMPVAAVSNASSSDKNALLQQSSSSSSSAVWRRTRQELSLRYHQITSVPRWPLAQGIVVRTHDDDEDDAHVERLLLDELHASTTSDGNHNMDQHDLLVDASRVSVIVDPLDGTKAYANGDYDAVSILICITLDDEPYFGVIGKPFGYTKAANDQSGLEDNGLTSMLDTKCIVVYGGPLLKGVYVAGGRTIPPHSATASTTRTMTLDHDDLPRAVISSSRSSGVVQDFCAHLADQNLIHREPLLISGAGEKSMRLILSLHNEALWFFPKSGTSLWDVAAPDALLRALGGKLTDKFGRNLDYSKPRTEAENTHGVVACNDAHLHAQCIALFQQGDWDSRI